MNEGRRVRSLRLRAATPALVQRGALLLEDALRTASMPDPGRGRVLFIRSLALGVIRPDRSPSSLALALERRVAALARDAVHAEEEGAPSAHAVYFADAVQALVALGSRLALRAKMGAWFWPLVVPEAWGKPVDQALRAVLAAALETEPGPAAAVALVEGLVERGAEGPLLGALRWTDGPGLARAFWGHAPEVSRGVVLARAAAPELEGMAPRARAVLEEWVGTWGAEDLRSVWLAAVVMSLARPARVVEAELPSRAMRVAAAVAPVVVRARAPRPEEPVEERVEPVVTPEVEERRERGGGRTEEPVPVARVLRSVEEPEAAVPVRPEREEEPPRGEARRSRPVVPEEAPRRAARPPRSEEPRRPDLWSDVPEPTRVGGLLFLVHALEHLGLPQMLSEQPELRERAVAEHFLAFVAARLGVPPEDPVLRALRIDELPALAAPCAFMLTERMRGRSGAVAPSREVTRGDRTLEVDARGRLVLALRHTQSDPGRSGLPDLEFLLRTLYLATTRLLRTRARISLRPLVLRPGRIAATSTHLDVLFDHNQAELHIRRAGMDVDPGWVPWLGRVIRYHYLYGEFHAP